MVMPLLAPWESLTLVQWVCNWGSSLGKNAGLSLFLPELKAWAKVDIEGWPRGTECRGVGGEFCFGSSKYRVEQPNLRLTGQIQGCRASQLWSRDDAPGLSTLAELGVLVGAAVGPAAAGLERGERNEGRCRSLLGGVSFYANAWEQLPCRRDSFPALVSHSGQASLAKAFFSPSPASPPSLPNAEGCDVHLLSPWQDEAGFSGNCVKATKPPYILKNPKTTKQKKSSTIFSYSFFFF